MSPKHTVPKEDSMTNTTHPLDASADAARAALIRMGQKRDARNAAVAAEVAPIVARLSAAQKRALLQEGYHDGSIVGHGATMRALEQRGLIRELVATGVGSNVWARYTETGGKVYRALRHEQWLARKAEMEAESAALG